MNVALMLAILSTGLLCSHCDIIGTASNEFYLGFLQGFAPEEIEPQLLVSTTSQSPVKFTVETASGSFHYTGETTDGEVTVVMLPWQHQVAISEAGVTGQKGIFVKAEPDKEVTVHGLLQPTDGDGYLAYPCSSLPNVQYYEYYAMTYHGSEPSSVIDFRFEGSAVLLVGCEDNTTITIDNYTTLTLNRLDTYLHYGGANQSDLTGTHYISNKPISVFSGHPCTFVPSFRRFCDTLIEQIPPTATWGTSFLSKSFEGRESGEIYRILAAYPSTEVTVSCNTMSTSLSLSSGGDWAEFQTPPNSYCSTESNRPILAMEYMLGGGMSGFGDPFMMMLPPIDQYGTRYNLRVAPGFTESYITVYVPPQYFQLHRIILNGHNLEDEMWTPVNCSHRGLGQNCGYVASLEVLPGVYQLHHDNPEGRIAVSVHGISRYQSYGYIGGLRIEITQTDCGCQNGGRCSLGTCDCPPGYGGGLCEVTLINPCHPGCENGGSCLANGTCSCLNGYGGKRCEEQVLSDCDVNLCQHGGNCSKYGSDFLCNCSEGYSGSRCMDGGTVQIEMLFVIIACSAVTLLIVAALISCAGVVAFWAIAKRRRKISDTSGQRDHHFYANPSNPDVTSSCAEDGELQEAPTNEDTEHQYDYVEPELDFEISVGRERISTKPNIAYGHLNN